MIRRRCTFAFAALIAALALAAPARAQDDAVTVFAAASLTDAMTQIAEAYREETGGQVRLSFAASSTLARQIQAGAPADMFASADVRWMDALAERGLLAPGARSETLNNALVLIAPADSALDTVSVGPDTDLAALLGEDGRLAVGDPAHVPAGRYAEQALTEYGLWDEAEPRLAPAGDVRAALALVARGEAPLGIVYRTDAAVTDRVKVVGTFPPDCHAPIVYSIALTGPEPSRAARRFYDYVTGAGGAAVFDALGFERRATC